ncbi:MAG TPA: hypothetical protein ENH82_17015 [bacterium]|nr:hypothetical protein [bacterium]
MKIIVIAMMMFFLNLSVAMVDVLGIYDYNTVTSNQWNTDIDSAKSEQYDPDIAADVQTSFGFGDFVSGFRFFRDIIFRAVNVSATIRLFDTNNEWGSIPTFFGFAVTFLYILGLAQFISNRSTKGMQ